MNIEKENVVELKKQQYFNVNNHTDINDVIGVDGKTLIRICRYTGNRSTENQSEFAKEQWGIFEKASWNPANSESIRDKSIERAAR